jgi:hypothetical protein
MSAMEEALEADEVRSRLRYVVSDDSEVIDQELG